MIHLSVDVQPPTAPESPGCIARILSGPHEVGIVIAHEQVVAEVADRIDSGEPAVLDEESIRWVLWHFKAEDGIEPTLWEQDLVALIATATPEHRQRLSRSYPRLVAAVNVVKDRERPVEGIDVLRSALFSLTALAGSA
ncbi:hypothetical protein [Streptosporangium longisporum]|uniref:Uncharacterized protein n=1 Tax=Streptosporangium longisporum TaxID=46187 RepID=A0ABP6L1Q8_9ACTN